MKIMMVITGMCTGGAERVMATLCNELSRRHEVRLLSMRPDDPDYALSEKVQFVKGNVSNKSLPKSVRFTRAQMKAWQPDVVLAFMTKSNLIALLAGVLTLAYAVCAFTGLGNTRSPQTCTFKPS